MEIHVITNKKPKLEHSVTTVDDDLHKKLNKYELTKMLNSHTTNCLIGRMKSGKSSLIHSFFKSKSLLKKVFNKIYYFAPRLSQASTKGNIFADLPPSQIFDELTFSNLYQVSEDVKANSEKGLNSCIIYDDMGAYLKDAQTLKLFKELCFNKRHYRLSQFFLVQTWFSVVKEIRRIFDNLIVFKVSKNELENIFDEVVEEHKEFILPLSKLVFSEPYQFLTINTPTGRLFKGFDEIILKQNDDLE